MVALCRPSSILYAKRTIQITVQQRVAVLINVLLWWLAVWWLRASCTCAGRVQTVYAAAPAPRSAKSGRRGNKPSPAAVTARLTAQAYPGLVGGTIPDMRLTDINIEQSSSPPAETTGDTQQRQQQQKVVMMSREAAERLSTPKSSEEFQRWDGARWGAAVTSHCSLVDGGRALVKPSTPIVNHLHHSRRQVFSAR
eukprot:COSAG05_NODE_1043_length_6061_cov_10.071285_4_plen_196_part_00